MINKMTDYWFTENDPLFPDEILEEGKKLFATSNLEHEIKTYPRVPHGSCHHSRFSLDAAFTDRLFHQASPSMETTTHRRLRRHSSLRFSRYSAGSSPIEAVTVCVFLGMRGIMMEFQPISDVV